MKRERVPGLEFVSITLILIDSGPSGSRLVWRGPPTMELLFLSVELLHARTSEHVRQSVISFMACVLKHRTV